jgi:hypothetical protein
MAEFPIALDPGNIYPGRVIFARFWICPLSGGTVIAGGWVIMDLRYLSTATPLNALPMKASHS